MTDRLRFGVVGTAFWAREVHATTMVCRPPEQLPKTPTLPLAKGVIIAVMAPARFMIKP